MILTMYAWCTSKKHDKQIQQLSYDEAQGGLMLGCTSGFNDILTNGSVTGQGARLGEEKDELSNHSLNVSPFVE